MTKLIKKYQHVWNPITRTYSKPFKVEPIQTVDLSQYSRPQFSQEEINQYTGRVVPKVKSDQTARISQISQRNERMRASDPTTNKRKYEQSARRQEKQKQNEEAERIQNSVYSGIIDQGFDYGSAIQQARELRAQAELNYERELEAKKNEEAVAKAITLPFFPSTYAGITGKMIQGKSLSDAVSDVWNGNSQGFFELSDNLRQFGQEHPYLQLGANLLGDVVLPYGTTRLLRGSYGIPNNIKNRIISYDQATELLNKGWSKDQLLNRGILVEYPKDRIVEPFYGELMDNLNEAQTNMLRKTTEKYGLYSGKHGRDVWRLENFVKKRLVDHKPASRRDILRIKKAATPYAGVIYDEGEYPFSMMSQPIARNVYIEGIANGKIKPETLIKGTLNDLGDGRMLLAEEIDPNLFKTTPSYVEQDINTMRFYDKDDNLMQEVPIKTYQQIVDEENVQILQRLKRKLKDLSQEEINKIYETLKWRLINDTEIEAPVFSGVKIRRLGGKILSKS